MSEFQYMLLIGNMYVAASFIIMRHAKGALFCSTLWVVAALLLKLFI
jgi:hypothetical protein